MAKSPEKNEDKKPSCFVIMPIADQKGYDDGHFTLVYEDIIKPAIIDAGMEVEQARADEVKNSNLIHLDILRKVIESDIAICDMSSRNPNVFYELGMRQAFDKPTVLIRDEDTAVPFDINGLRYVEYKKGMRHRDVVKAIADLTSMLKATYQKKDDKSEVNSLIRLMDLTAAKVQHIELTEDEKSTKLLEIQLDSLKGMVDQIIKKLDSAEVPVRKEADIRKWKDLDFRVSSKTIEKKAMGEVRLKILFSSSITPFDIDRFLDSLEGHGNLYTLIHIIKPDTNSNDFKGEFILRFIPQDILLQEAIDIIRSSPFVHDAFLI
ncbi:hypothetical protein GAW91_003388 [Vibrio fluvialis]|nr:hypothetical protein [Vibrio fluvialis]